MSASELTSTSEGTGEGTIDAPVESSTSYSDASEARTTVVDGERTDRAEGTSTEPTDSSPVPSKDVIFDVLKNERRRQTLQFLREEPTTTLSDIAEHVAAIENDKPIREITSSERKRVYVGLYQCHLPKMADVGVVDYDRSRGTVELRDSTSPYFVYLDIEPGDESRDGGRLCDWLSSVTSIVLRR